MWVCKVLWLIRFRVKELILFLMILNSDNRGIIFLSLLQLAQRSFRFLLTESCTRKGIYIFLD